MTATGVRRALHSSNALAFFALFGSGLLLQLPDLRAWLIGGYGREIEQVHLWLSLWFVAAPALALGLLGRSCWRQNWRALRSPLAATRWRSAYTAATVLLSAALVVSGLLLWVGLDLPLSWIDASLEIHLAATWLLAASVLVHLIAARRGIAARTRQLVLRLRNGVV